MFVRSVNFTNYMFLDVIHSIIFQIFANHWWYDVRAAVIFSFTTLEKFSADRIASSVWAPSGTLTDIYDYQILTFMNDYSIGRLPVSFNNIFRSNHEVQDSYATRQREQMYIARCNSTFSSKLPLYSFPRKWNEWFEIVRACNSRWTFKKHVKATMIGSYRQNIQCQNTHCKQCKWKNYPRNTLSPFNSKKIFL